MKERELLQRCAEAFSIHNKCPNLIVEIQNLLAQPEHITDVGNMVEQEPVAWCQLIDGKVQDLLTSFEMKDWINDDTWIPLYTAPPKREPIDTRMITLEMFSEGIDIDYKNGYIAGIRFAEKEHGIGVGNE